MMKRLLWIILLMSMLIFAACTSATPPTPPSTTLITSRGMTIPLVGPWTAIDLDSENVNAQLTALQDRDDSEAWQAAVAVVTAATDEDSIILMALYEGQTVSDFTPRLSMSLSSHSLNLRGYLQTSRRMLSKTADVQVARLDDNLLSNGAPVGILHIVFDDGELQAAIYRAFFLDETAKHMVVMSFITLIDDFEALLPLFQDVVRNIKFDDK